jgi:hypothetical protein
MVVAEFNSTMPTTGGGNVITNFPFRCSQYSPLGPKLLLPQSQVITDYYMALSIGVSRLESKIWKFADSNYTVDRLLGHRQIHQSSKRHYIGTEDQTWNPPKHKTNIRRGRRLGRSSQNDPAISTLAPEAKHSPRLERELAVASD